MLPILTLAASAFALTSPADQALDIKSDPQLKTPVTLSVKYGPLREVFKSLSKQVGTSIVATGAISDLKITVFASNVPCRILLDRIGAVLDCEWKDLAGTPTLSGAASQRMISDFVGAEDVVLRKKAESDLNRLLKEQGDPTSGDGGPTTPTHIPRGYRNRLNAQLGGSIAKVFEAGQVDMDAFWNGAIAHTLIPQGDGLNAGRQFGDTTPSPASPGVVIFAKYDIYGSHDLQIGSSQFPVLSQRFELPPLTHPSDGLETTKYGQRILAWPNMSLDKPDEAFDKPYPAGNSRYIGFGDPPAKSEDADPGFQQNTPYNLARQFGARGEDNGFGPQQRTQSDLLQKFAHDTGIPVVSDGFRIMLSPLIKDPSGATPLEWLKALSSQFGSEVQVKDGVAAVRQGGYWRLRQYEIPEDLLRPMEKIRGSRTLNDYSRFFYALTPWQARTFQSSTPPEVSFSTVELVNCIPALRFLGSVGADFPLDGTPVPVTSLGSDAQQMEANAVSDSIYMGGTWRAFTPQDRSRSYVSAHAANISRPEGLVPGVELTISLPMGEQIVYDIPLAPS